MLFFARINLTTPLNLTSEQMRRAISVAKKIRGYIYICMYVYMHNLRTLGITHEA